MSKSDRVAVGVVTLLASFGVAVWFVLVQPISTLGNLFAGVPGYDAGNGVVVSAILGTLAVLFCVGVLVYAFFDTHSAHRDAGTGTREVQEITTVHTPERPATAVHA